jgi:hypothetical protein
VNTSISPQPQFLGHRVSFRFPTPRSAIVYVPRPSSPNINTSQPQRLQGAATSARLRSCAVPKGPCVHRLCWGELAGLSAAVLCAIVGAPREAGARLSRFCASLPEVCGEAIMKYTPRIAAARWEKIRDFVEDATATAAPACAYTQERLLVVVSGFVDWVVNVRAVPMRAELVFRPEYIRTYLYRDDAPWAESTRRDYRALLMRVSEVLVPGIEIAFAPLNDRVSSVPYTEHELQQLVRWAEGQATANRRRGAAVLLSLSAGGGLWPHEIQRVHRFELEFDGEGILVHVTGPNPRIVPLMARWEPMLRRAVFDLPADHMIFGRPHRSGESRNLITNFIRDSNRADGPKPQTNRMRATWLVTQLAAQTDMRALMQASGVQKFEQLSRLLQFVPALDTAEYRRQLRQAVAR